MQQRYLLAFTLIELMAVIAIIGILFAFAVPQYHTYIMRAERSFAISELDKIMSAQERYYADEGEYADDLVELGYPSTTLSLERYDISAAPCTSMVLSQCVQLIATPLGAQVDDGTLVYSSIGTRQRNLGGKTLEW